MLGERFSGLSALALVAARDDDRIAKGHRLDVFVLGAAVLAPPRLRHRLSFVGKFAVGAGADIFIGQHRGGEIGIVGLVRLKPLVLQHQHGFLGITAGLSLQGRGASEHECDEHTQDPVAVHDHSL
jgi:hypothetical protein